MYTLRVLARRCVALQQEIDDIDELLKTLVNETAPELVALSGLGTDTASALLVAAGDNPERLRTEATFAHLCGVAPIDASSGKNERHRLNRGVDRQANQCVVAHRDNSNGVRRTHPDLHRETHERRPHQKRSIPMPQALHRTRTLQPPPTKTDPKMAADFHVLQTSAPPDKETEV